MMLFCLLISSLLSFYAVHGSVIIVKGYAVKPEPIDGNDDPVQMNFWFNDTMKSDLSSHKFKIHKAEFFSEGSRQAFIDAVNYGAITATQFSVYLDHIDAAECDDTISSVQLKESSSPAVWRTADSLTIEVGTGRKIYAWTEIVGISFLDLLPISLRINLNSGRVITLNSLVTEATDGKGFSATNQLMCDGAMYDRVLYRDNIDETAGYWVIARKDITSGAFYCGKDTTSVNCDYVDGVAPGDGCSKNCKWTVGVPSCRSMTDCDAEIEYVVGPASSSTLLAIPAQIGICASGTCGGVDQDAAGPYFAALDECGHDQYDTATPTNLHCGDRSTAAEGDYLNWYDWGNYADLNLNDPNDERFVMVTLIILVLISFVFGMVTCALCNIITRKTCNRCRSSPKTTRKKGEKYSSVDDPESDQSDDNVDDELQELQ